MGIIIRLLKNLIITPSVKGRIGEARLERKLDSLDFWGYHGYCLRNVYVPRKDGTTSEIDVVYITPKGLFVIESKNYAGYIFGDERYKYWTSTLYAGKNWLGFKKVDKNKFYNPIWQNNSHISALRNHCGFVEAFSIIAFGDNCELKDINWNSSNVEVCYYSEIKKVIKRIWNNVPDVYDEATVNRIYKDLLSLDSSTETRVKHVNDIKYGSDSLICPRCGSGLVLRTARNGAYAGNQFYGCSNYPKCKYIRNL